MKTGERFVVLGFKTAWALAGILPQNFLDVAANKVAIRTYKKNGKGIQRLRFNLARVANLDSNSKAADDLTQEAILSYMNYWVSMFALPKRNKTFIQNNVSIENPQILEEAIAAGKGAMIAVTHSGNWDLAGAYIAQNYGGITTVAERLRPVELFDEFTKHRKDKGIVILPHRGGTVTPSTVLINELNEGKLVGLVADRDLSSHGIEINFFGHTAKYPQGPAKIVIETGSPLIPAAVWAEDSRTYIKFYPQIDCSSRDVTEITQSLAKVFEEILKAHPQNWHMLQKIWLDMPAELAD